MYHVIQVGMNAEALRQLDELRQLYPDANYRAEIIVKLILEAHAKFAKPGPTSGVNDNGASPTLPAKAA